MTAPPPSQGRSAVPTSTILETLHRCIRRNDWSDVAAVMIFRKDHESSDVRPRSKYKGSALCLGCNLRRTYEKHIGSHLGKCAAVEHYLASIAKNCPSTGAGSNDSQLARRPSHSRTISWESQLSETSSFYPDEGLSHVQSLPDSGDAAQESETPMLPSFNMPPDDWYGLEVGTPQIQPYGSVASGAGTRGPECRVPITQQANHPCCCHCIRSNNLAGPSESAGTVVNEVSPWYAPQH